MQPWTYWCRLRYAQLSIEKEMLYKNGFDQRVETKLAWNNRMVPEIALVLRNHVNFYLQSDVIDMLNNIQPWNMKKRSARWESHSNLHHQSLWTVSSNSGWELPTTWKQTFAMPTYKVVGCVFIDWGSQCLYLHRMFFCHDFI